MKIILGPKKDGVLYHYTGHKNLRHIVESRCLWISNVYYMGDANEIKYGAELFKTVVATRANQETEETLKDFLTELRVWVDQLIGLPHYIFVFSLTERGNILSQWRGYTPRGELGVSIGFNQEGLERIAKQKGFVLLKCIWGSTS